MTRDQIIEDMQAEEARAESGVATAAAAYVRRGELFKALVRGAYDEGGQFRAFDVAHGKLSQDHFAKRLVTRMRQLGLGGVIRHRLVR